MHKRLNGVLRSLLYGVLAFFVLIALEAMIAALHPRKFLILGTPLQGDLTILVVFALAIAVGITTKSHAWRHGLLAGLGIGVPGFLIALHMVAPDLRTWKYMLGRPPAELWMGLASILVVTSLGAQSTALWRERRRLFSLVTVVASVGCVVAIFALGIRIIRYIDRNTQSLQASNARPNFDMPLLDLKLITLDGRAISQSEFQGHITVLDFWGTWCGACIAEFPFLEAAYKDYLGNPNVRFLLVKSGD